MNILSFLSENIKNATLFCCGGKVFVISHRQSARPASERKLHQKTFHEIFLKLFSFGQVLQVIISAHHHRSSFALFAFHPLLVLALTWNLTSARYNISCIVVLIQRWKMSNLLHGPISTNQILPREKRVNCDIFGTSNPKHRSYGVSCDE